MTSFNQYSYGVWGRMPPYRQRLCALHGFLSRERISALKILNLRALMAGFNGLSEGVRAKGSEVPKRALPPTNNMGGKNRDSVYGLNLSPALFLPVFMYVRCMCLSNCTVCAKRGYKWLI